MAADVPNPATPGDPVDVEAIIARNTVKRAVFAGPLIVAIFGAFGGLGGAVGSLVGVVVVVVNFLVAGLVLSAAARVSLGLYHAAALFGFLLRLVLVSITMVAVARLADIDRVAMGVSAVVAYLVLLSWEAWAVSRGAERELEWIS